MPPSDPPPSLELQQSHAETLTREELLAENQCLFEEMNSMEQTHEQTLAAAVDALESSARERRALERQIVELKAANEVLQQEKLGLTRERNSYKTQSEEVQKDLGSFIAKIDAAHQEREKAALSMIAIESETANLLNWLIKEGRILEQDDDTEAAMEVEAEERAEELRACSLNDVGRTSQGMRKSSSAQSLTARPRSRSKLGGSPLAQTASLTTLYASSMAIAGAITGKSERFLATSSPAASTDNAPPSPNPTHQRTRTSSVSHLRLSVSSLSKVCESKLPSSLTSMEARILAQLSQIAVLLKAVLALQEETSKQLWDSRKRFKIMEVQVGMLGEWRDCVMQRVGMLNVDKVPIVDTQSAQEISASMDLTREISKKLQSLKNQTNAFLIQMEA